MSQVDVQWPSEDEDFDAKADAVNNRKTSVKAAKVGSRQVSIEEPAASQDAPDESSSGSSPATNDQDQGSEVEPAAETSQPEEPEAPTAEEQHEEAQAEEAASSDIVAEAVTAAEEPPIPQVTSTPPKPLKSSRMPKNTKSLLRMAGEAVLVLAVIGLGLWSWSLYNDRKDLQTQVDNLNANPQVAVQRQTQALITSVGKLITLPSSETPTVAEVSNAAQARQQSAFFTKAQNGDKVLMYVKSGEAILYRPSTNKIILVAPLTFSNNTTSTTSKNTTSQNTTTSTPATSAKTK